MGCANSKATILPPSQKNVPARTAPVENDSLMGVMANSPPVAVSTPGLDAGHWAEMSPNKAGPRREAHAPWQEGGGGGGLSPAQGAICAPCAPSATASGEQQAFQFNLEFPMMVMKMDTFMDMKVMESYETMMAKGLLYEWTPALGKCFFLSHQ